jgi:hypothetical protein
MPKKFFIIILLIPWLISCEKESDLYPYSYQNESTIYSSSTTLQFREILLNIKPYILTAEGKRFVVTDSLLNVSIKMNETNWGVMNSLSLDTSAVQFEPHGFYNVCELPLKYNVLARYQPSNPVLNTAGQYADMLRSYLILEPGFYFCRVSSFQIRLTDGSLKTIPTLISENIEVSSNTRSLYIGEFEVEIR